MRLPFSAAAPAPALRQPKPASIPDFAGLSIAALYRGARTGGDFFDFATTPSGHLLFLLLDVAGQRAQAFDISAKIQETFHERGPALFPDDELNESLALTELVLDMNRAVMRAAGGVRCTPGIVACYDPRLGATWYVNAGHTPAVLRDRAGAVTELAASGLPFGLFSHTTHDAQLSILNPGSSLVLVSKGLVETRAGSQEFGLDRVRQAVVAANHGAASAFCEAVLNGCDEFVSSAPRSRIPIPLHQHRNGDRTVVAIVRNS